MEWSGDPWLVRIEDGGGRVCGAGTLLSGEYVLTCAHVVEQAQEETSGEAVRVRVRVKGHPDESYVGSVVPECWQPPLPGDRGDVAVLELRPAVPGAPRARVRRTWQQGESVRVFGFPEGTDNGEWVTAGLVSRDFNNERVQANALHEPRVDQGFSGGAALAADGEILGIIAGVRTPRLESSWMIEARTLLAYAGSVLSGFLTSPVTVDPQFTQQVVPATETLDGPRELALTRHLVDWLAAPGPGGVCAVGGGGAMPLIARLVRLTVPDYRRRALDATVVAVPPGTLPHLGGFDAAVDATGRTMVAVAGQLAAGLNLPADRAVDHLGDWIEELGSPVVIAVNAVDAAADPLELLHQLLLPLAVHAPSAGVRLLLGFRDTPPGYLRRVVAADLGAAARPESVPADGPQARLDALRELLEKVKSAEQQARSRYAWVAPRILGVPEQRLASSAALTVRIGLLRELGSAQPATGPDAWFEHELAAAERLAQDAIRHSSRLRDRCDALLDRRDRARARLEAVRSEAVARGLTEEAGESYEAARRSLYSGLCDLRQADRLVRAYRDAVLRETGGRTA